ncbi:MAG: DHA2 family efflux MFS transporter permease subunit, partial [Actinomycetota bacterium]|nr:DHA2 family efflux MFS transporter permease subunit [Actinomycetota bacterium]
MASPPGSRKRPALVAAIMGSSVAGLDATVVNVALPAIEQDLGGGLAGQQWVSNAYLLTLGSLILVGGSLGDLFGERRIFALGVCGFGVVSLGCALSPSIEALIGFRALQGVFGALLTPSALALIVAVFSGEERGAAIGTWTAWGGIAMVLGPVVGGYLIGAADWRWIFAINVPLVLVTLGLILAAVPPRAAGGDPARVDGVGALLCAVGLAGPVFALIQQPANGWGSPAVLFPGLGGVAILALFLAHERRASHPMLELSLFSRRNFAVGNAQTFAMYAGLSVLFFFLVLFLQQVAGYEALEAGLATLPITVVMFVLSSRMGRLADRHGPRLFMGAGPLLAAGGLLLMLRLDAEVDYLADLLPGLLVFSVGLSMTVAPLTGTVLADADEHNAGIASGINNAVARVAGLLAIAALGAVISARFGGAIDDRLAGVPLSAQGRAAVAEAKERNLALIAADGLPAGERARLAEASEAASLSAFRLGMGISAALVALGGLIGAVGIVNRRREVRAEECPGGQLTG